MILAKIKNRFAFLKKIIFVLILIFFALDVLAYLVPTFIPNIIRFYYRSPIKFEDMEINFPKGISYQESKDGLSFHYWNEPFPSLNMHKLKNLNEKTRESLIKFIEDKNFKIIKVEDINYKDYPSTIIYYVDDQWRFFRTIFVYNLNLIISYTGSKDKFEDFNKIIESIDIERDV